MSILFLEHPFKQNLYIHT